MRSRAFTLVEIMVVVVILGLIVSLAMPAFRRVRMASQDRAILNNARQLAAGADQYFLECGVSTADLSALVGPDSYVKSLSTVAGESYPEVFTQSVPITISGIGGNRTITYFH